MILNNKNLLNNYKPKNSKIFVTKIVNIKFINLII